MSTENKQKNRFSDTLFTTIWVTKLIFKLVPILVVSIFTVQILTAILPYVQNRYFSDLIDQLLGYIQSDSNTWIKPFIILVLIAIFLSILTYLQYIFLRIIDFKLENELRKMYTNKVSSLDYQHLENDKTTTLISKVNEEYLWRTRQIFSDILDLLSLVISSLTILVILIPHYWYLALLLLLGEVPSFFIDKKWTLLDWQLFNNFAEKNRQSWDIQWELTTKNYLTDLKINNALNFIKTRFANILDEFTKKRIEIRQEKSPYEVGASILSNLIIAICLLIVIRDIKLGLLTIGLFTFYFNTVRQTGGIFSSLFNRFISISEQILYINNFREVMELENIIQGGNKKKKYESAPLIEFKNVYFKYPTSKYYVFKNLNLSIYPNEEIAIIGANGAGKSTLIKLLCRFYDPESGEILINGVNIKELDLDTWYQHLSILFQEFTTYQNLSLKENVAVGNLNKMDNKSILNALRKAEGSKLIKKYNNGLDTLMSTRYGGVEPSWGQWQKIAIARIFHRNTPILILDEPTSSIDADSEYKIFNHLYEEVKNKTVIIISHRFSTVRNAQRIIILKKGKIAEQGSHEELLAQNGTYAKSFNLQAQGYH